jgi:hypothetical protein
MSALKGFIGHKASALVPDRYGTRISPGVRQAFAGTTAIFHLAPGSDITPRATRRFQMNSTTSAPIVAVMNPAP